MNRWSWLAVLAMIVALPALAQNSREREWERFRGSSDFRERQVVIEKRRAEWMLNRIDNRLAEIINKAKMDRKTLQALKDLREDVKDVRQTLDGARDFDRDRWDDRDRRDDRDRKPMPPGPRGPQQPYIQPPPPGPGYHSPPPGQPTFQPAIAPMAERDLRNLLGALSKESFANDKLRVLGQAAPTSWFLVAQTQEILGQFTFPRDRLEAVRILRPRILDTNNFFQLYASFEFPRDKDELKRILGQ